MTMKNLNFLGLFVGLLTVLVIPLVTSVSFASPQNNSSDPGQGIIVPNGTGILVTGSTDTLAMPRSIWVNFELQYTE